MVEAPPPGIIIYRFEESFLYPNASYINDRIVEQVKKTTRRGKDLSNIPAGDRPWNDPGPKRKDAQVEWEAEQTKPRLRAVILDFAAVANLDTTGVQNLVDTRKEVEKWADRPIEFHFSGILSPWIRRALIAAGFGHGQPRHGTALEVAPVVPQDDALSPADREQQREERLQAGVGAIGSDSSSSSYPAVPVLEKTEDGGELGNVGKVSESEKRRSGDSERSLPLLDRATPFVSVLPQYTEAF